MDDDMYQTELSSSEEEGGLQVEHIKKRRLLKESRAVISHISYEEEVQFLKKRWLTRRWPEYVDSSGSNIKSLSECIIPESLLRDDNSAVVMKSKIQESFDAFKEDVEPDNHSHQSKVEQSDLQPEKIQGLPDRELFACLPILLEHFRRPALLTLVNVVTGKPYQSAREILIKKIQHGLSKLFAQTGQDASECLQKVKNILRDPESIPIPKSCTAVLTGKPSGLAAAKSTLSQLGNLPSHTLHAMNRKIRGKPHAIKLEFKKIPGKKSSLAQRIKNKGEKLLKGVQESDPLPEPLKKALLVASLSARQTCGEDGGLLEKVGPISSDIIALHNDFLKAISLVQKLDNLDLKDIYGFLSSDNLFSSKSPCVLQRVIRTFLVDWLFECSDKTVPEPVMKAITMINKSGTAKGALRERDPIRYKTVPRLDTVQRLDTELECVLNVSSHLQQIIYDWTEHAGLDQGIAEIPLDDSEDEFEPWFTEDSCGTLELDGKEEAYVGESFWEPKYLQVQECGLQEHTKEYFPDGELRNSSGVDILSKNNCHTEDIGRDTGRETVQNIQEVCDEASLFTYRLVGCMMDELLRRQGGVLEASAMTYLQSGFPTASENTGESEASDPQQSMDITILLNTAQKLCPKMPLSVIEKTKLSLGVL